MNTPLPPPRPLRRGICDGDDIWPQSLTDAQLREIAAIDAETKRTEGRPPRIIGESLGDVPVFSLAERVRHWILLVEDTENGSFLDPGEFTTELGCRELVSDKLTEVSDALRQQLMSELLNDLDERFKVATVDDGAEALRRRVRIDHREESLWWWSRRPVELGPLWNRKTNQAQCKEG